MQAYVCYRTLPQIIIWPSTTIRTAFISIVIPSYQVKALHFPTQLLHLFVVNFYSFCLFVNLSLNLFLYFTHAHTHTRTHTFIFYLKNIKFIFTTSTTPWVPETLFLLYSCYLFLCLFYFCCTCCFVLFFCK